MAGPDISNILDPFLIKPNTDLQVNHHEATVTSEKSFATDVKAFLSVIERHGNPFADPSKILKHLINGIAIENKEANDEVMDAEQNGIDQYKEFCQPMNQQDLSVHDRIPSNDLKLFSGDVVKKLSRDKLIIQNLKAERTLYKDLFIASQARGADMELFFEHDNHPYPVAISQFGELHPSKKSDVLDIFAKIVSPYY